MSTDRQFQELTVDCSKESEETDHSLHDDKNVQLAHGTISSTNNVWCQTSAPVSYRVYIPLSKIRAISLIGYFTYVEDPPLKVQ